MKYTLQILFVSLTSLFILSSCEKVIDLDLNEAEKKYVIEAVITDEPGTAKVQITQTKNFDEDNNFPGISGATVTITEAGGATYTLAETTSGVYQSASLTAQTGKTYNLSVNINGNNFTAACKMPVRVNFDTLYVTNELLFTEFRNIANVEFKDPAGLGNAYRFIQYVNGLREDQVLVQNDDYTDGRDVNAKLFYFSDDEDDNMTIHNGDTLTVDMLCIDPVVYKYWYSLYRSSIGGSGQATPSNPVSNMQGGALGYFSAHSFQRKTMIVP